MKVYLAKQLHHVLVGDSTLMQLRMLSEWRIHGLFAIDQPGQNGRAT